MGLIKMKVRVFWQLQLSLASLAVLLIMGTAGYRFLEEMSWFEALYMTVITLTTVGFSEVKPLSGTGRAFTLLLLIVGVGVFMWVLTNLMEVVVGEEVRHLWGRWKMERKAGRMEGHFIICGYGRIGRQVVAEFQRKGVPFVVIEQNPEVAQEAREKGIPIIEGDATLDGVLETAGVGRAKGLVAVADSDADNVFVVLSARSLNPNLFIVARSETEEGENKLHKAGADRVIAPYAIGGRRIAVAALRPTILEFLDALMRSEEEEWSLEEVRMREGSKLVRKSLREADVRGKTGAVILAVKTAEGEMLTNPPPDRPLKEGDTLIALGTTEQLEELVKLAG